MATHLPLLPLVRKFFESDPVVAGHTLEAMEEKEAAHVLEALPPTISAQVIPHMQVSQAAQLLRCLPPEIFGRLVERLKPHQATQLIINLPAEDRLKRLGYLSDEMQQDVRELLTYPEDSAGRIMTTDFLTFRTGVNVKDAIHRIRALVSKNAPMTYCYVVDDEQHLLGVLSMRDLMLAPSDEMLENIMRRDIFTIDGSMDREEVANQLSEHRFFAAPVVDAETRLLGIVKSDQLIEEVQEEATEDMQKMYGAGGDEKPFSPVSLSLRKRLPWLHVNLLTAFAAAAVIALFQDLIARITILAVFLPIVAGQGGNAGAQTLAVVIRGIVLREIPPHRISKLLLKEVWLGILNGLVIGAVAGLAAWLWNGNPFLGVVIALAMLVSLAIAGLAGAVVPLGMKALRKDPAQSSMILLTTITDIVGFFTFLGFAMLFQQYLI